MKQSDSFFWVHSFGRLTSRIIERFGASKKHCRAPIPPCIPTYHPCVHGATVKTTTWCKEVLRSFRWRTDFWSEQSQKLCFILKAFDSSSHRVFTLYFVKAIYIERCCTHKRTIWQWRCGVSAYSCCSKGQKRSLRKETLFWILF